MKKTILASLFTSASLAGISQAASISWSAPADITDENVIISPISVVQAYNVGGPSLTVTVGGTDINFAGQTTATGITTNFPAGNNNSNADYWTGTVAADADFNTLLDSQKWNAADNQTIPLAGLTIGTTYQVQLFSNDQRTCCNTRLFNFNDGVNFSADGARGSNGVGQFIVGTFTADATTQNFQALGGSGPQLNAVVIAAIPEPSGTALIGLSGLALILRRRRS